FHRQLLGLSPCLKFVIGRALTILSWDDPVTAFFEKVEKLRHSLGRPSRSDFVQFQLVGVSPCRHSQACACSLSRRSPYASELEYVCL
ncbi:MAG: hypothetical protein J6C12_11350, partial [Lachnospiraceae bacterium]|nr:hypothetical protein [Lachnospiraceae bacterium]